MSTAANSGDEAARLPELIRYEEQKGQGNKERRQRRNSRGRQRGWPPESCSEDRFADPPH